jgi:hypothetical protein
MMSMKEDNGDGHEGMMDNHYEGRMMMMMMMMKGE